MSKIVTESGWIWTTPAAGGTLAGQPVCACVYVPSQRLKLLPAKEMQIPSTLVDCMVLSSSVSHEVASVEVKDLVVAASILERILEETS